MTKNSSANAKTTIAEVELISGLSADKTADRNIWVNGKLTYSIVVSNTTDVDFEAAEFTDTIDSESTLVENSVTLNGAPAAYTYIGGVLSIPLPAITAGSSATITFEVQR